MDEVEDLGLLNIGLADSDDASGSDEGVVESRADRSRQSEAEFQQLKSEYRVKVENGEIYKTVRFPLDSTVSKPQSQELLHAVEELYFFHRYDEAVSFIRLIFSEEGNPKGLDEDTTSQLRYYEVKCAEKAKQGLEMTESQC